MALSKAAQRRGGGRVAGPSTKNASSRNAPLRKVPSRTTGPKKTNKQRDQSSPRLRLVRDQAATSTNFGRAGASPRYATDDGQTQEAFPAPRARGKGKGKGKGNGGWQGGIPTASTAAAVARGGGAKHAKVVDEGAKAVNGLRNNLKKAAERVIGSAEAECDAIVTASLEGWSVDKPGKEEDGETAEAALRELESSQASAAAQCSEMLKALESNRNTLSALAIKSATALDALGQSESRKLKSMLDRATRAVS